MSQKTKAQLEAENQSNFPNNNTGYITAERLRQFNTDMIDSMVDEGSYNTDSASFSASIDLIENQIDNLIVSGGAIKVAEEGVLVGVSATLNFSGSSVTASYDSASKIATIAVNATETDLTALNQFSASINLYTGSTDLRLDDLESKTGSYTITSSFNSYTSSTDDRLDSIELETGSLQSQIDSLSGVTGSYATTSSLNALSSSLESRLTTDEGNISTNTTNIQELTSKTGSYATTGSNTFVGPQTIKSDLFVDGDITARTLYVDSSSIIYTSGSTKFGDSLDDVHEFTGSVVITGSLTAPLQHNYVWIGDVTGNSVQISTSSLFDANTSGTSGTGGTSGTSGIDGTNGTGGTSGTSGIDGTNGTAGTSGIDGTNGTGGTSGTSGVDGANGSSGTSGIDGTNGTAGTSGVNGADGTNGTGGTSGTSGISGTATFPYTGSAIFSGSVIVTGSIYSDSTAYLTASWAENAGTSSYSQYADNTIVYGKNVSGGTIEKGTPLYFTGSGASGNIVGVWPADAGNPARMPAGGIAGEQMLDEAEGIVLINGFIDNVDTSLFNSGDEVYVGVGGGYTNVAPTGSTNLIQKLGNVEKVHPSNGSGVINGPSAARSVPNIAEGYAWVGNSDGVATATPTSSFGGSGEIPSPIYIADEGSNQGTASLLDFTGNGVSVSVTNSTASININTGSQAEGFPYTGSARITGSLGVTGSITTTYYEGSPFNTIYSGSVIDNGFGNYTEVPRVKHVVSITSASYAALATRDPNTMYIVTGSQHTSGTSGTSGVNGTNGDAGSSGTSGVNGTGGTSGVNGTGGTSGTSGISGASFPYSGSAEITGSIILSGSFNHSVVTSSLVSSTASIDLDAADMHNVYLEASNHLTFTNKGKGKQGVVKLFSNAQSASLSLDSNAYTSSAITINDWIGATTLLKYSSFDGERVFVDPFTYQTPVSGAAPGPSYSWRADAYSAYLFLAIPGSEFTDLGMTSPTQDVSALIKESGTNVSLISTGSGDLYASSSVLNYSGSNWADNGYTTALYVGGQKNLGALPWNQVNMGNTDFVVEGFIAPVAPLWANPPYQLHMWGDTSGDSLLIQWSLGTQLRYYMNASSTAFNLTDTPGTYYHFAFVRSGTNKYIYVNGTRVATGTFSGDFGTEGYISILGFNGVNDAVGKLVQDFRVYIGTDKGYTGSTITVPSSIVEYS